MIKKQWQLAIDYIDQFAGEVTGDNYSDIVWSGQPIPEQELINKYNEVKRDLIQWKEMVDARNNLLTECDWTQNRDVQLVNDAEWQTYRQSLRDITDLFDPFIEDVVWPEKP